MSKNYTIALAGQPNTGKSTVFNQLTGSHQHVGNWPGKTVEQKTGSYTYNGASYEVVDLPGTYGFSANSVEEVISRDFLVEEKPDAVVVLLDAAQLERTMYLLAEVIALSSPVIVGLNMMDVAADEGLEVDIQALAANIGVPVVPLVASKNEGITHLMETIHEFLYKTKKYNPNKPQVGEKQQATVNKVKALIGDAVKPPYEVDWVSVKLLEGDETIRDMIKTNVSVDQYAKLEEIFQVSKVTALEIAGARYAWIQSMIHDSVKRSIDQAKIRRGRFDTLATHPIWGIPLAVLVMIGTFVFAFIPAIPLMILSMQGLPLAIEWVRSVLVGCPEWCISMVADGLIPGVGMALSYLGWMVGVFLTIGLVEDVGYMARVAFIADRFMSRIGLHRKKLQPMFTSIGCNISGVLGSRVVDNWEQRMMTMVMAPIVPCLAVWGVTGFFGSLFFGANATLLTGILLLALILWLYITGVIFKRRLVKGEPGGLLMELPPYHKPNWKTIWRFTLMNSKSFLVRGVTLVAGASLMIWALSYLPNGEIETSFLASIGMFLEPVGRLMGLDWRLMIALIASMISKESSLATLGILYGLPTSVGGSSLTGLVMGAEAIETTAIAGVLQSAISPASALAFVFAVFFSIPCLGTIGSIYSESKSWRWALGAAAYYMFATVLAGFLAYRVGLIIL